MLRIVIIQKNGIFRNIFYKEKACVRIWDAGFLRVRRLPGLVYEGFAVGTFHLRGIELMGAYLDLVQGAVVLILGVMRAVVDGAGDGFVFVCHHISPPFPRGPAAAFYATELVCTETGKIYVKKLLPEMIRRELSDGSILLKKESNNDKVHCRRYM